MSEVKFTKSHEWARLEDEGIVVLGITDHAQHALGDMVFVELPDVGEMVSAGKECAVVESVKSASDVYAPLSGEVVEVNDVVTTTPELLNRDPEGEGWLCKIRLSDVQEFTKLLDAKAYAAYLAETAH